MLRTALRTTLRSITLAILALILVAVPVLAVVYRAPLTIVESAGTTYTMLPVSVEVDNQWLADNGFQLASALDTRVETLSGLARPHMVVDDRTLTAVAVPASSQTNLYYTTGNTALASLDIIAGYNGMVETEDAAALEMAAAFEIEFDGYVVTTEGSTPIVYKPGAFLLEVSVPGTITAGAINADSYEIVPGGFGAWRDIDVSDYVPDGASGVVVEIDTNNATLATGVRKNGSTDDSRTDTEHYWAMIGIDDDEIFEVWLENNTCHIYIRAYTDDNWVYKTNADDISLGVALAWTDIDISAEAPNATVAIIEIVNNAGATAKETGVRMNGSTDNRHPDVAFNFHTFRVVGLDSAQIFEGYIETDDVDFYLIGYATAGATFAVDATNRSLGVSGAWTDVDSSVEAPDATYLFFEFSDLGANDGIGFRENGDTLNTIVTDANQEQGQSIVKADMGQIVEAYEADHTQSAFYLNGYTEYGIYPAHPNPTYLVSSSVGAGALTSGVKNIKVTGAGGNLILEVDTVTDTNAIGAGVTNTTMNWRELISPAVPYTDAYTHTVGGVLQLTYLPVTMVIGRVLIDETNAFDGTFNWGSNPVAVSLDSLVAASQPSIGADTDDPTRDILPEAAASDWFETPDVTGALLTHPLRPFVTIMSDTTTLTERQAWTWLGIAFVLFVLVLTAKSVRGHHLITGVATGAAIGALVTQTIFPLYALVFVIVAILGGIVSERSKSL